MEERNIALITARETYLADHRIHEQRNVLWRARCKIPDVLHDARRNFRHASFVSVVGYQDLKEVLISA